ncbi:peptidoglycan-binding protein [Streptomyces sp. NPDC056485]|uniref:peptidoglycan-binding protein n=1 Tax=Streptomyces sp. NPDC056485 TaxID=3345834 RepID=UPI0036A6F43A
MARRSSSRRRRVVVAAAVVSVLAAGGVAVGLAAPGRGSGASAGDPAEVQTASVTQTDLSTALTKSGTLGYGTPWTLRGPAGGRVTLLPASGAVIRRGQQLYRVNDRPAMVFYGATPLFRRLDTPGTVGRDVRVVADNLRALGHDIGPQPPVGTLVPSSPAAPTTAAITPPSPSPSPSRPAPTGSAEPKGGKGQQDPVPPAAPQGPTRVREGDAVLTPSLIAAVTRWQQSAGMTPSGVLDVGDVVVTPGPVRVGDLKAQPGDDSAADLLSLTGTEKVVTLPVSAQDSASFEKGQAVTVTLPDGSTAPGRISAVSTVIQATDDAQGGNAAPKRTVTVQLDDAGKADRIDAAPVQVQFTGRTKQKVLAVPVGSLVALSEGGYALQTPDGRLIKVTTGMFAKGLVEVSGDGVSAGLKVVTTS